MIYISKLKQRTNYKKISINYNIFFVKKIYISFFKNIAKIITEKSKKKKKIDDIDEYYLINLVRKTMKRLYKYMLFSKEKKNKFYRRILIGKILFKNLKIMNKQINNKYIFYRNLHLKKYYFKRLKRTVDLIQNNRIAKLKFISKYILLWKKAVLINRRNKANGILLLLKHLEIIKENFEIKGLKTFIINFKKYNAMILKYQINELKIQKFKSYRILKQKRNLFNSLKYNKICRYLIGKRHYLLILKCFKALKMMKNMSIPLFLKIEDAEKLYRKNSLKIIKIFFKILKTSIRKKKLLVNAFRIQILKAKLFKSLIIYSKNNKKNNEKIIRRFRIFFLKHNFFQMLKLHTLIIYRENKILSKVNQILNLKALRLKNSLFHILKKNMIIERFIRQRNLRLKAKVFYVLKILSS